MEMFMYNTQICLKRDLHNEFLLINVIINSVSKINVNVVYV